MSKQIDIISKNIFKSNNEDRLRVSLTKTWIKLINQLENNKYIK